MIIQFIFWKMSPIPFYHAPVKHGGMGISQQLVPCPCIQRLKGIWSKAHRGYDNFMANIFKDNVMLMKEFRKFGKDIAIMPKDAWKKRVAESLYRMVDDYGLRSFSGGRGISEWLTAVVPKRPSLALAITHQVLKGSRLSIARWGPQIITDCDAGYESKWVSGTHEGGYRILLQRWGAVSSWGRTQKWCRGVLG